MMVGQQVDAMANPEHLKKLSEGPEAWNNWVEEHREATADLSDADFSHKNLSGANLRGANLKRVKLTYARLIGVSMPHADLELASLNTAYLPGANFVSADLRGADLRASDLSRAHFDDANLERANLGWTNLNQTTLTNANLAHAQLQATLFADDDLSAVRGLETVQHLGPSTIGIDTIYRSKGKIPDTFLRGCGVPETFITFAKSLVASPIEFYSCFISYSSKDGDFATEIHGKLQAQQVRCWKDSEDLKIGDRFQDVIENAIRLHDKLLVVLSENSVNSPWVEREVQAAFEKEQRQGSTMLFPVRLDDAVMDCPRAWAADIRRTRHIGDFRKWKDHDSFQKSLDRLLRDLKSQDFKPK
jgi:hypothetical protein